MTPRSFVNVSAAWAGNRPLLQPPVCMETRQAHSRAQCGGGKPCMLPSAGKGSHHSTLSYLAKLARLGHSKLAVDCPNRPVTFFKGPHVPHVLDLTAGAVAARTAPSQSHHIPLSTPLCLQQHQEAPLAGGAAAAIAKRGPAETPQLDTMASKDAVDAGVHIGDGLDADLFRVPVDSGELLELLFLPVN